MSTAGDARDAGGAGDAGDGGGRWAPPGEVLPHRPPFLLVDEIVGLEEGRRVEGRWRPGPGLPVVDVGLGDQVPGSLVVEAVAQVGAYGAVVWSPEGGIPLFAQLDRVRFRRPVRPGATVDLVVEVDRLHRRGGRGRGRASVDGEVAVDVALGFLFVPLDLAP
jgi:3-hydroxyacyl-[acyl-carrier-protein] dehydratase